ncbi:thioredoxin family protein [Pelagibacteraceae bacterium]|nr:thioredoxin family protein [Pelagibacteraceae bacterium]
MVLTKTPICNFGEKTKSFELKGIDGQLHKLEDHFGKNGLLIMFICNHCPYVKAVIREIAEDCASLKKDGVNSIAIMSNDTKEYPEDSFENMKVFSNKFNFSFPYLIDETQIVAKQYGAVCTPDFFGYNSKMELQYRGRIRELKDLKPVGSGKSDLFRAMQLIIKTKKGPKEQIPSMGCNIKWTK